MFEITNQKLSRKGNNPKLYSIKLQYLTGQVGYPWPLQQTPLQIK